LISHAQSCNFNIKPFILDPVTQKDTFSVSLRPIIEAQVSLYTFEGKGLNFDAAVPNEIVRRIHLAYQQEGYASTEVCYVNSPEIRPEFKVSFTTLDLADYLNGVLCAAVYRKLLQAPMYTGLVAIPYPGNGDEFWTLVQTGMHLRQRTSA
jgi:hypothetical protein